MQELGNLYKWTLNVQRLVGSCYIYSTNCLYVVHKGCLFPWDVSEYHDMLVGTLCIVRRVVIYLYIGKEYVPVDCAQFACQ